MLEQTLKCQDRRHCLVLSKSKRDLDLLIFLTSQHCILTSVHWSLCWLKAAIILLGFIFIPFSSWEYPPCLPSNRKKENRKKKSLKS